MFNINKVVKVIDSSWFTLCSCPSPSPSLSARGVNLSLGWFLARLAPEFCLRSLLCSSAYRLRSRRVAVMSSLRGDADRLIDGTICDEVLTHGGELSFRDCRPWDSEISFCIVASNASRAIWYFALTIPACRFSICLCRGRGKFLLLS